MFWIGVTIMTLVGFVVLRIMRHGDAVVLKQAKGEPEPGYRQDKQRTDRLQGSVRLMDLLSVGLCVFYLLLTAGLSVHRVEAGKIGIVKEFGAIKGQRGSGSGGPVITAPWASVEQINVQVQRETPQTDCDNGQKNCLNTFSSDTQAVYISPVLNVYVTADKIQDLYRTVGADYINKIVIPLMTQVTKDETVKYTAKEIAPHREDLRVAIRTTLTTDLQAYSIVVSDFLLSEIAFTPAFQAAIDQATTAQENAITEQANVAVEQAKAEQSVAQAQGRADSAVVEAEGQAKAIAAVSGGLTPAYIEYLSIQKLNPNVQVMMVPSGNGLILDVGNMMNGGTGVTNGGDTGS